VGQSRQVDKVRIVERRRVFDDVFAIDEAVIKHRRHDGSWTPPQRQLCFERGDSVAALLVNRETGNLVLVNQFRYPTYEKGSGWLTEIVAGGVDDESPEEAIVREVREETGCDVENLAHISTFYVSPGGTSERVILYYGEIAGFDGRTSGLGVGDEDIQVIEKSPEALWQEFLSGHLRDAKTIIALLWLRERGRDRS
jgi:nudix-type nucleoside diphosphatase (YffH/AdpP family)